MNYLNHKICSKNCGEYTTSHHENFSSSNCITIVLWNGNIKQLSQNRNEGGLHARSLGTPFGARLESMRPIEKPSTLLFWIKTALPYTILIFLAACSQGCSLAPNGVCRPHACHFHYVAIFERTVESQRKIFNEKIFSIPTFSV